MSSSENSEVSLTIRTPTLADEDVEIWCRLDWTVIRVKREIEQRCEKRPRPADQVYNILCRITVFLDRFDPCEISTETTFLFTYSNNDNIRNPLYTYAFM